MKILAFSLVLVGIILLFIFNWEMLLALLLMMTGGYIWRNEQMKQVKPPENQPQK